MRISTSITFQFREWDLADRFAAARDVGVDGVELQSLEGHNPALLARARAAAGIPVALLNVELGDLMSGGPGLSCVPGREALFEAQLRAALAAADALEAGAVHLGPGRAVAPTDRAACLSTYRANLEVAAELAEKAGRPILIEAMNTREIPDIMPASLAEAAAVLDDGLGERIGLQFDIYHATLNGEDVPAAIRAHAHRIRHVQFSDAPGRHQPGTGQIDFAACIGALKDIGYEGWIGAEYMPRGPSADSFGWLPGFRDLIA